MKALITAATFAALAFGATAAQASHQGHGLTATERAAVKQLVPGADLNGLNADQVRDLRNIVAGGGHMREPNNDAFARHILSRDAGHPESAQYDAPTY